ncbi:DEAD/DEAH box helicase family protein [bacterium]|nr:DEAD/DEAH box helicase family protein [bacterium]
MPCPFCQPDPTRVFHQGDTIVGLWDAYPVSPGHALLITRRHLKDWFDASPEEQRELTAGITLARLAIKRAGHDPQAFNVGMNLGEAAGQTVEHLHLHVIPRYSGDVPDPRGGVRQVLPQRANYWSGLPHSRSIITGEADPLGAHLAAHLERARRLDMAVAFVQVSGIERLWNDLASMLQHPESRLRLVTGDYLGVTDPDALQRLLTLKEQYPHQVELRVFETRKRAFHPKAYLLGDVQGRLVAVVGSSNLSESALGSGLEWNFRDQAGALQVAQAFEDLYQHPDTVELSQQWVAQYRARRVPPTVMGGASLAGEGEMQVTQLAPVEVAIEYRPNDIQREALEALSGTRAAGNQAGLVVLATGLGKTYLAAFDSLPFGRVLFVAHRNEILQQAGSTFARVRPQDSIGYYHGQQKDPGARILFANIATVQRTAHLHLFARDAFDYIVVDEFHHAATDGYRRLIDYFQPTFLLGLTATPERSDGGDLLGLCLQNLVYRCDLTRGISDGLLSPFKYYGVPDTVDYGNIPWRRGGFDPQALDEAVAVEARAQNSYDHYRKLGQSRTLAFCCSQRHADFMGDFFRRQGVRVAVVHSGPGSDPRGESVRRLETGELDVLCCVDIFNEGLDVPAVDTVLMLRPTESRILWMQQLGRGLRLNEGKTHLTVIDYIGNHRSFLWKPQALLNASNVALRKVLDDLRRGTITVGLPDGCEVTYDPAAVDLLEAFVRARSSNALEVFYTEFREFHGRRPTALEAYQARVNPGAARQSHGSWIGYVSAKSDLQLSQPEREFLAQLETTAMSKSYKMVLLQAMIALDAFPGQVAAEELAAEFARRMARSSRLVADLSEDVSDTSAIERLVIKNPIAAWAGGPYFDYVEGRFRSQVTVTQPEQFVQLTSEIAEWCLARYLDRSRGLVCKLIQASGGKPIVKLDDKRRDHLPQGLTPLWVDGVEYEADFVKIALNVVRPAGGGANLLAELLRGWFGPNAGSAGSRHEVMFEKQAGQWSMLVAG